MIKGGKIVMGKEEKLPNIEEKEKKEIVLKIEYNDIRGAYTIGFPGYDGSVEDACLKLAKLAVCCGLNPQFKSGRPDDIRYLRDLFLQTTYEKGMKNIYRFVLIPGKTEISLMFGEKVETVTDVVKLRIKRTESAEFIIEDK